MEYNAYKLDRTRFFYRINPGNKSSNQLKPALSMPSDLVLVIHHSLQRKFYVGTANGDFHLAEEHASLVASKSVTMDASLLSFRDERSVECGVHWALTAACVDRFLWGAISKAVMREGVRMVAANMDDTIMVDVVTRKSFVCYENVGEC